MQPTAPRRGGTLARLLLPSLLLAALLGPVAATTARAEEADYAIGASVTVAAETVNYRADPGLAARVITVFARGQRGTVVGGPVVADGYTWYQLATTDYGPAGATPGWLAGEFLTTTGDGFLPGGRAVVRLPDLNLRAAPGLGAAIIATLPLGREVVIGTGVADANGLTWHEVAVPAQNAQGWVAGTFLAPGPEGSTLAVGDDIVVTLDGVNMRDAPGLTAPIRQQLALGTAARIIGGPALADGQTWYRIAPSLADNDGWVVGMGLARR